MLSETPSRTGELRKLRFIHLSDIHFSNRAAQFGFDPDRELRRAVLTDIREMVVSTGDISAILVSGDLSYAGKREEFEDAATWLDEVCAAAGCAPDSVLICPGNHDIDQQIIRENPLIQDGQDAVRRGESLFDKEKALTDRLVQPEARALFYSPLKAYNEFAARYECSFFADKESYVWEEDFELNDGSILRIRGLNTALLSGLSDFEKGLFLGPHAWTLPKQAGVEYLVIAHHPPAWLADGRETERAFEGSARVHLFGHEHDQRVQPGRDWMKLYAGAVNPHRAEPNWRPGYNLLEIWIDRSEDSKWRLFSVQAHVREWQGSPPQFRSQQDVRHSSVFTVSIRLDELPHNWGAQRARDTVAPSPNPPQPPPQPAPAPARALNFRQTVYKFFRLSLSKKIEIVGHLRLAEDGDSGLVDVERFKLALKRAQERGQLVDLARLIDEAEEKP